MSTKNTNRIRLAWWHTPAVPATREAEAGELLEPRRGNLRAGGTAEKIPSLRQPQPPELFSVAAMRGSFSGLLDHFAFPTLLQTEFHHVGQAGLELPTSDDPPALASKKRGFTTLVSMVSKSSPHDLPTPASQSAGITGVSHAPGRVYVVLHTEFRSCCPGWSAMARSRLTSQVQVILLAQPPKQLGLQVPATTPGKFVVFSVEMGFHHVGQAGLELLTSGVEAVDPPASASQSAGITGVSHCTRPCFSFKTS
ncbi:hypothetical protein AAY473_037863 [Plecturocebus cupreus]